jgi:hypothetical protein
MLLSLNGLAKELSVFGDCLQTHVGSRDMQSSVLKEGRPNWGVVWECRIEM